MSLHKSNFLEIHQMSDINGIKIKWLKGSENMKDEEFKAEIIDEKDKNKKIGYPARIAYFYFILIWLHQR